MADAFIKINKSFYTKTDAKKLAKAMSNAMKWTMHDIETACKDEAPVKTGNLKRSHVSQVEDNGYQFQGILKNSTNYWPYVNWGSSKQKANPYINRAFTRVQPNDLLARKFARFYDTKGV